MRVLLLDWSFQPLIISPKHLVIQSFLDRIPKVLSAMSFTATIFTLYDFYESIEMLVWIPYLCLL